MKTNFVRAITADTGLIRCEGIVIHGAREWRPRRGRSPTAAGKLLAHGTTTCLIFQ